jgi:glycosyltransferase involved in cell wall biosynthesis
VINGLTVHRVAASRGVPLLASLLLFLSRRRDRYDVIHNHMVGTYVVASLAAGILFGKKVVSKFSNSGLEFDLDRMHRRNPRWKYHLLRRALNSTGHLVVISKSIFDDLDRHRIRNSRVHFVPNGLDLGAFRPDGAPKTDVRAEIGATETDTVFLRVGSVLEKKGVRLLMKAFDCLAAERTDVMLVSVGGEQVHPDIAMAMRRWPGRVFNFLTREDVTPFYAAADVFVLPSHAEGLSNALIEAQAFGLASVVSSAGGNPEVVSHGRDGMVFTSGDVESLLDCMRRMASSAEDRRTFGSRARISVRRYQMDAIVDRYINEIYVGAEARFRATSDGQTLAIAGDPAAPANPGRALVDARMRER